MGEGGGGKEPENDREWRDLIQHTQESGADEKGGGKTSHQAKVTHSSNEDTMRMVERERGESQ